jgi:hypothetical protein
MEMSLSTAIAIAIVLGVIACFVGAWIYEETRP